MKYFVYKCGCDVELQDFGIRNGKLPNSISSLELVDAIERKSSTNQDWKAGDLIGRFETLDEAD